MPLHAANQASQNGDAVIQRLKDGHERFLQGECRHPHTSPERLKELVSDQHPYAAILGCSDSRVPIELLFDVGFGDLFVVRNAGNTATSACIASLEYAVLALGVQVIIVLGHEGCGAVTSAYQTNKTLTPDLQDLMSTIRTDLSTYSTASDLKQYFRENPVASAKHLIRRSRPIKEKIEAGSLVVEAAYYTLQRGAIEWLKRIEVDQG